MFHPDRVLAAARAGGAERQRGAERLFTDAGRGRCGDAGVVSGRAEASAGPLGEP